MEAMTEQERRVEARRQVRHAIGVRLNNTLTWLDSNHLQFALGELSAAEHLILQLEDMAGA